MRSKLISIEEKNILKNGYGNIFLSDDERFKLLYFRGKVPSRFNSNFIYSLNKKNKLFSTDIATGAKSNVYPPKYIHWGSGIIGNGYNFCFNAEK